MNAARMVVSMIDLPREVYVAAALVALFLAVREAGRVRRGDRSARRWFAVFLASAAMFTWFVVDMILTKHTK